MIEPWTTDFYRVREALEPQVDMTIVNAETPSPVFMGYETATRRCVVLLNLKADLAVPQLDRLLYLAHELGHCQALRSSLQELGPVPTAEGEAFGDIYALSWLAYYEPQLLDQGFERLLVLRNLSRRVNPVYNTLIPIRLTYARLTELRAQDRRVSPQDLLVQMATEYKGK